MLSRRTRRTPSRRSGSPLRAALAALALALAASHGAHAQAQARALSAAEHDEIARLLETFFTAARDGDARALAGVLPTDPQFARIFMAGTEPLVERHRRAIARALADLRTRFAGGRWVAMRGLDAAATVHPQRCASFAAPNSECLDGPVIEWVAGTEALRMRVNRLVRVDGHWRLFAPRL
ncbi:MAG: hypothetical protein WCJ30_18950 [Deltaproteobacteria bacterium]